MKVITRAKSMQEISEYYRCIGKKIGLVPTMGYLHQGHVSLIEEAREECDVVLTSIYVNPKQFLINEDLGKYPKDFSRDYFICEKAGADYIFKPDDGEMYGENHLTDVEVSEITGKLEGAFRPGHFTGVTTVVLKLLNIAKPHNVYFGQKDAQQVVVIRKMMEDLNVDSEQKICPTIREESGLAMSSRNVYLDTEEKERASIISFVLNKSRELIESNTLFRAADVQEFMKQHVTANAPGANIEYIAITDNEELNDISDLSRHKGDILISLAVKFGETRLIDNILFNKN